MWKHFLTPALVLGFLTLSACSEPTEDTAAPGDESAVTSAGVNNAEVAALPELPTHWTNTNPVGNNAGPVNQDHLLAGLSNPADWLLYGGDYGNFRHSPVEDLTPETVKYLQVEWAFPTGTLGQFETSPTIHDGIMYVSSSYNRLFALDPKTGELFSRYDHQYPEDLRLCCSPVNRGVAISGDLYVSVRL